MKRWRTFRALALIQTAIVMTTFIVWWVARTAAYIKAPIGPYDEYYPHNWGFQMTVGGIYCVPVLAITAGVIILERWMLDIFSRGK
jgi:hypothetical protein